MPVRMTKPFLELTPEAVDRVPGQLGVFELADASGRVVFIGQAGGRSLFGLRGEIGALLGHTRATRFRYEVNTAYATRYRELLMAHRCDFGSLPEEVDADIEATLGRLSLPQESRQWT